MNQEHLGRLPQDLAGGWKPDLARLETLKSVRQMTPRDYRESWAWVHYLLNGSSSGKSIMLAYLADLHGETNPEPLSSRLHGDEGGVSRSLVAYIDRIRSLPAVHPTAGTTTTVRLQDNALEPQRAPAQRRGFFGRLRAFFSL